MPKPAKPWEWDGRTYCTLEDGSLCCTGTQHGRPTILPEDINAPVKMWLERLRFPHGDCYDTGAAYWGFPSDVWCAYAEGIQVFVRSRSRAEAKDLVRQELPGARFFA